MPYSTLFEDLLSILGYTEKLNVQFGEDPFGRYVLLDNNRYYLVSDDLGEYGALIDNSGGNNSPILFIVIGVIVILIIVVMVIIIMNMVSSKNKKPSKKLPTKTTPEQKTRNNPVQAETTRQPAASK